MQENTEQGRPNTMQNGGIIRKMQPDVEGTTAMKAGGLLTKKRVHYEGDALNKSAQKQGWMTSSPTDKESPVPGSIRTIQLLSSPLENERILRSSHPQADAD